MMHTLAILHLWTVFLMNEVDPLEDGAQGWSFTLLCSRNETGRMYPHTHVDLKIAAKEPVAYLEVNQYG